MKFRVVCPTVGEFRKANEDRRYPALDYHVGELESRSLQLANHLLTTQIVMGRYPKGSAVVGEALLSFRKPLMIILQGLAEGNSFFSTFSSVVENPMLLLDGTKAYRVLGYANGSEEAQIFLYGKRNCITLGLIKGEVG